MKCISDSLQIPLEEAQESQHMLLDILHHLWTVSLPVNEALPEPAKTIWQTPATAPPTINGQKYYVLARNSEYLFSHPPPNSLVVEAVNEHGKQSLTIKTRNVCLFGHKRYSSVTMQFRITNYQGLMVKYNHANFSTFNNFIEKLLEELWEQFQAVITEGQLLARVSFQASLDAANTAAQYVSTDDIMHWVSWM